MRIAYLVSQYPAPSHTFIRREVVALRDRGLNIQTFSVRRPLPEEIQCKADLVEFENTWYILPAPFMKLLWAHFISLVQHPIVYFKTLVLAFRHRVPGLRALFYALFYFGEAIFLAHELKRRKIEHLHNHFAQAGAMVGFLASRYLDIRWSLTLHGICDFEYPSELLLAQKIAAANFVACISYFGRAQAMRFSDPIHWPKLFVYRCGVVLKDLPVPVHEKKPEYLQILCVARLSPEKGLTGLVEAFAKVLKQGEKNMKLSVIGEGPERSRIEEHIIKCGVKDHCVLLGRASEEEVFHMLSLTDIFVISSFLEGLPVVLMEALALGVPVIAPCVAGIPELIENGRSGLLFSPGHWEELAEKLMQLSHDDKMRARLATEGQQHVRTEFDIQNAVELLYRKFQEIA